MIKLIEPSGSIITRVVVDEEGFVSVHIVHPACGVHESYAFGPLELEDGKLKCNNCGDTLLEWRAEDDEMPDAVGLGPGKYHSL